VYRLVGIPSLLINQLPDKLGNLETTSLYSRNFITDLVNKFVK
jgi:hypothetical protein